jgi:hypothetical protein
MAEEQVEEVTRITVPDPRTGVLMPRYLFLAQEYATLAEAEAARQSAVIGTARDFYRDLDRLWLKGRRAHYQESGPAALPPPDVTVKPPRP